MEQKEQEDFDIALLLLFSAERTMVKRKVYEGMHNGMTLGFSDNPYVLIQIQNFLSEESNRERLERLLKN